MYLYLLHSEVQEGVLVTDADQALGALTSHAGTQASIQLHHHQFVQAVGHVVRQASSGNLIIRLNLEERKEMAAGQEKKSKQTKIKQINSFNSDSESAYNCTASASHFSQITCD